MHNSQKNTRNLNSNLKINALLAHIYQNQKSSLKIHQSDKTHIILTTSVPSVNFLFPLACVEDYTPNQYQHLIRKMFSLYPRNCFPSDALEFAFLHDAPFLFQNSSLIIESVKRIALLNCHYTTLFTFSVTSKNLPARTPELNNVVSRKNTLGCLKSIKAGKCFRILRRFRT